MGKQDKHESSFFAESEESVADGIIFTRRPPLDQQLVFFNQFHTYIKSGISMLSFFPSLTEAVSYRPLKEAIARIQAKIEKGQSLGRAFAAEKEIFTRFQKEMISLGEDTGNLENITFSLSRYLEKQIQIRNRILSALILPMCYLCGAILLPPLYIAFVNGLLAYITFVMRPIVIILLFIAIPIFASHYHIESIILLWDGLKLRIPYLGSIIWRLSIASFCRAYAIATKAGAGLSIIIKNSVSVIPNSVIRQKFRQSLWQASAETDPIPIIAALLAPYPIASSMFKTGTATGNIPEMMEKAADYLEEEAWTKADTGLKVFPIMLLLIIALYIGYIVITFWLSYFRRLPTL